MAVKTYFISNEDETASLAQKIASELSGGELIALDGDLGAGKTFFAGALCESLNIKRGEVNSPTFVIMKKHLGKFSVYHWDFYRMCSEEELHSADFFEYLKEKNSINIVEWASKFKKSWESHLKKIEIKITFGEQDSERRIEIKRSL
ncbi:MAG: tRNA (adenosine(37)-N6)-threonylcarbamoyltransferase complex ATPase subunit type 1 TsaE [bacterium]